MKVLRDYTKDIFKIQFQFDLEIIMSEDNGHFALARGVFCSLKFFLRIY